MINDFEHITYELTESELELVPIIMKGISLRVRRFFRFLPVRRRREYREESPTSNRSPGSTRR